MLDELMDIFLGMYYAYVSEDYPYKDYFVSIIAVIITACMIFGTFLVISVIISETFKTIRGCSR